MNKTEKKASTDMYGVPLKGAPDVRSIMNVYEAQMHFTHEEIQKKMEELVFEGIMKKPPDDIPIEAIGKIDQWDAIDRAYPDNTKMLMINNKIRGFWTFLVLKDEIFQLALRGKLREGQITLDSLEDMQTSKEYKGYFLDIVVSKKHRTLRNLHLMIDAFAGQIEAYAERGCFLVEWCANAYSDAGKRLSDTFGLKYVCDHEEEGEGQIYYAKLSNESLKLPIFKKYPRLVELYSRHFTTRMS